MTAETIELVVERERELETRMNTERERLTHAIETHAEELDRTRDARIEARKALYERQTAAFESECVESVQAAVTRAVEEAKRFTIPEEEERARAQEVLNRFSWQPSPSTK